MLVVGHGALAVRRDAAHEVGCALDGVTDDADVEHVLDPPFPRT